jgi:hypothetical protein
VKTLRFVSFLPLLLAAGCSTNTIIYVDPDGGVVDPDADPGSDGSSVSEVLAKGLTIDEVAVYQGVKIDVVKGGVNTPLTAPIIAKRPGLVRIFVKPDASWQAHSITAKLFLRTGGNLSILKDTRTISGASTDADINTTFRFFPDGTQIDTDTTWSVELLDQGTGAAPTADDPGRYPHDGTDMGLGAKSSGAQLKITMFPILLTNGITPDTSAGAISTFSKVIRKIYPIPAVNITVGSPLNYGGAIPQANGANWDQLLNSLTQKRNADKVAPDVYYFGVFIPNASFQSFCGGGCVAGLSNLSQNVQDAWARASISLGYAGQFAEGTGYTIAHEVGHAHGRNHAPCGGAQGVDPQFPDPTGGIGVWGYDIDTATLIDPAPGTGATKDIMGYCDPKWISNYNYKALFARLVTINGADMQVPAWDTPRPYRMVRVLEDGTATVGDRIDVNAPLFGEERTVSVTLSDGTTRSLTGNYYGYDHVPGGYVMVPEAGKVTVVKAKIAN